MAEGIEVHTGSPGVIERHGHTSRVRRLSNRGNILHFHGDGARTFAPYKPRVRLQPRGNAWTFQGWVIFHIDVEAPKYVIGEAATWAVDALRNQNVVASA